jgi:hypothetical protein
VIGTDGNPVPGARLYAYRAGSTDLQTIYADPAYNTPLPNPVIADAFGILPVIYLDTRGPDYRLSLTDAAGAVIPGRQADNIAAASGGGGAGGAPGTAGENAFYVVLSRQTTALPADSAGVVSSYSSANGVLRAFNGGLDVTELCELSVTNASNCSGTINTAPGVPVGSQPAGYYQVTAVTADVAELRLRAVYGTRSVEAVFTLVKAKGGAQGAPGAPGGGTNSVGLALSREAAMVPSYADGTVISFTGVDGTARLYDGTTEVTGTATWSATATNCTGTINTATDTPVVGQPRGYYRITAMTADTATLAIQASYASNTYNRVFTATKLKGGYEIVGTLPVTNLFQGRLVFLTTDNKLYRYTGSAWTAQVTSTDLVGQLTAAQINVTQLSALSANLGTVTAGVVQDISGTTKLDASNGHFITNNGIFMNVTGKPFGSSNQFIEWYGPSKASLSLCTETDAKFYKKIDGSAYFGGTLSAGVLTAGAQTTNTAQNASVTTGVFTTNGNTKSVVVSYSYVALAGGLSSGDITATQQINSAGTPQMTLVLERSNGVSGSSWTLLQTYNVTGTFFYEEGNVSFGEPYNARADAFLSSTFPDNSSGYVGQMQYRVRLTASNGLTPTSHLDVNQLISIQSSES